MKRITALVVAVGWLSGCAAEAPPQAKSPQGTALVSAGWVDSEGIASEYGIDESDNVSAATPLHAPVPEYPEAERTAGIEARVLVRYEVTEDGRVVGARASGPVAFREKALEAIAAWRFQPALRDGAPQRVRRVTQFVFRVRA